jgi:hypothetical protein
MTTTSFRPFQPDAMTPTQRAAVSYLARYSGHTHAHYACQLRCWFAWCETNALDPLVGIQRAHIELYIRHLGESGLMASSINTSMHAVRGLPVRPHRWPDRPRPHRLRPAAEGALRRVAHPRPTRQASHSPLGGNMIANAGGRRAPFISPNALRGPTW